jgi:hypothetical protein
MPADSPGKGRRKSMTALAALAWLTVWLPKPEEVSLRDHGPLSAQFAENELGRQKPPLWPGAHR